MNEPLLNPLFKHVGLSALVLALFALFGSTLVAYTEQSTRAKIAEAEKQAMLNNLHEVMDPNRYDNPLLQDVIQVTSRELLGSKKPVTVYRARLKGQPVGLILSPIAPDGYAGAIKLLVGVDTQGVLTGVRVIAHHETPGLGDAIEERRSSWIHEFDSKSLVEPVEKKWRVKRDSGAFDQFTGATITPRAVVKAVKNALLYVKQNQQQLFDLPNQSESAVDEQAKNSQR